MSRGFVVLALFDLDAAKTIDGIVNSDGGVVWQAMPVELGQQVFGSLGTNGLDDFWRRQFEMGSTPQRTAPLMTIDVIGGFADVDSPASAIRDTGNLADMFSLGSVDNNLLTDGPDDAAGGSNGLEFFHDSLMP